MEELFEDGLGGLEDEVIELVVVGEDECFELFRHIAFLHVKELESGHESPECFDCNVADFVCHGHDIKPTLPIHFLSQLFLIEVRVVFADIVN